MSNHFILIYIWSFSTSHQTHQTQHLTSLNESFNYVLVTRVNYVKFNFIFLSLSFIQAISISFLLALFNFFFLKYSLFLLIFFYFIWIRDLLVLFNFFPEVFFFLSYFIMFYLSQEFIYKKKPLNIHYHKVGIRLVLTIFMLILIF